MIVKNQKLNSKLFQKRVERKANRDGFGEGLVVAGERNERVVAITADLRESTRVGDFSRQFPARFFDVGVAEQTLVTVASGLANYGKIPFATTYAVFSPGRTFEQIKVTACLNNLPVKIVGCHAGLGAGPYGATHQSLEDIALMVSLSGMVVVCPCDFEEAKKATVAIAKTQNPTYLRLAREETAVITSANTPFKIGKAEIFWETSDPQVAIIACGPLVYEALWAARQLEKRAINTMVINNHTIKPLDERTIIRAAKTTGAVVTIEEHQVFGGMGSAVAEILTQNFPVPMEIIGVNDSFSESGSPEELRKKFGLTAKNIIEAVKRVIARKII